MTLRQKKIGFQGPTTLTTAGGFDMTTIDLLQELESQYFQGDFSDFVYHYSMSSDANYISDMGEPDWYLKIGEHWLDHTASHNMEACAPYQKIFETIRQLDRCPTQPFIVELNYDAGNITVDIIARDVTPDAQADIRYIFPTFGPAGQIGLFAMLPNERFQSNLNACVRTYFHLIYSVHIDICAFKTTEFAKRFRLTKRERDVLHWVTQGKSNSAVAEILGISPHTVNAYLRSLFIKTKTHERVSLAMIVLCSGVLQS